MDVVTAPSEHPRGELVRAGPRGPFALEALGIDSAGVLDELPVLLLIEADIGRHVAVDEVEGKEGELRLLGFEVEHEPVGAGGSFGLGGGVAEGEIGPVVGEAVDGPPESQRIGVLPAVVRLGFEGYRLGITGRLGNGPGPYGEAERCLQPRRRVERDPERRTRRLADQPGDVRIAQVEGLAQRRPAGLDPHRDRGRVDQRSRAVSARRRAPPCAPMRRPARAPPRGYPGGAFPRRRSPDPGRSPP